MTAEEWFAEHLASAPTLAEMPAERVAGVDHKTEGAVLLAAARALAA